MNHSGSAFRKLAPYYAKRVEKSKDGVDLMDVPSFLRVSTSCDNYAELTDTLTSTMHLKKILMNSVSEEDFVNDANALLSSTPIPPMNQSASGTLSRIVDVPPILMCESNTVFFYEEVLYGGHTVDSLVNNRITHLLERFLFMRPERICNAYMTYVRQKNNDIPAFEVSPRCLLFAGSKFDLNKAYSLTFTITNRSNAQQTVSIQPVPNVKDVNLQLELSEGTVVVKKGRTATVTVNITFTSRSTQLSKLILFISDDTRDFVNISATSQQKVFGIEPSLLPSVLDEGFHVPSALVALKEKLLSVGGLTSYGVFRLAGLGDDIDRLIEYLDDHGDEVRTKEDIPCDQVNVIASVIKQYFRSLPVPILNSIDLGELKNCKDITDNYQILSLLSPINRDLLMWVFSLLADIANHCADNKMNSKNLAMMFAPDLFSEDDDQLYTTYLKQVIDFCDCVISYLVVARQSETGVKSIVCYETKSKRKPHAPSNSVSMEDRAKRNALNTPFNPRVYTQKKKMQETISKTTFVNPELERLQKEIALLTEQKKSIDLTNKEKLKPNSKKEVVIVNGDKYVVKGSKMDKVVTSSMSKKKEDVCLTFCKYGSCSNPTCRNRHDPSLIRICPAFLRGCCQNEQCTLSHVVNPELLPLCSFYLSGHCANEHCNFRHEQVSSDVPICHNFNAGYCAEGSKCQYKHLYSHMRPQQKDEAVDIRSFLPSFVKLGTN